METKEYKWVITGINRLTRRRERITRAMMKDQADERLQLEIKLNKGMKYKWHSRLKVERLLPEELELNFVEDEI